MAELDHINDIDNAVVYNLKDTTARQTIADDEQYFRNLFCVHMGNAGGAEQIPGYGWYNIVDITLTSIIGAFNVSAMDGAFLRIIFRESPHYDYTLPIIIRALESDYHREVFCHVYTDTNKTEELKITGTETIDFIYDKVQRCFFVVGRSSTGDLSDYYTKSQIDNLLNAKANTADLATVATTGDYNDLTNLPTIPAAQVPSDWNASAGVARILNKPNLSAVATSGDYDDLSNKPDLSVLQYLANIAAADDFVPGTSYSYLDFVKYNDRLYLCISSSGSTAGTFDPTEWAEIIIGEQVGELTRTNLLANQNENRLDNLATVATSGAYSDLTGTPPIPAAQVNSDWNASGTVAEILNKPNLSAVATSGNYSDLNGAPTLAPVATSGLYADLAGAPTLAPVATSGDYDDLTDKPTFKTINGNAITGTGDITTPDTKPGSVTSNNGTNTLTVANNQWVDVATLSMTAGKLYLVSCCCVYPSNATGQRGVGIRDNNNTPVGYIFATNVGAGTGGEIIVTWTGFIVPTSGQTYVMITRQSSGATINNVKWRYRFVPLN